MAKEIVARIDQDPSRRGFLHARMTCARWMTTTPSPAAAEWNDLLAQPWEAVRALLLRDDEEGRRLRQSSPFSAVLSPKERWAIYREFAHESPAT